MLTSDMFLRFHDCPDPLLLMHLLQSNPTILAACRHYAMAEPNYGPLMFRCKEFLTSPAKEVCLMMMMMMMMINDDDQ